jgi:hypothetical protein
VDVSDFHSWNTSDREENVGLNIAARIYDLDAEASFKTSDILDMHAVAKHSTPVCTNIVIL